MGLCQGGWPGTVFSNKVTAEQRLPSLIFYLGKYGTSQPVKKGIWWVGKKGLSYCWALRAKGVDILSRPWRVVIAGRTGNFQEDLWEATACAQIWLLSSGGDATFAPFPSPFNLDSCGLQTRLLVYLTPRLCPLVPKDDYAWWVLIYVQVSFTKKLPSTSIAVQTPVHKFATSELKGIFIRTLFFMGGETKAWGYMEYL